jgi:Bacterial Ig-like domain (group 2)
MKLVRAGSLLSAALCVAACGSSSDSAGSGSAGSSGSSTGAPKALEVFPAKIYSGFDGANKYLSPIIAVGNKGNVTWTIDDPSIASIDTNSADPKAAGGGINVVLTSLKAGTTTIHATDGTQKADATLTVTSYPVAQYEAGKARYTKGPNDNNPACTECHAPGKGPDHTPTELDADTDDEVRNTFVTGTDPEGRPVDYKGEFKTLLKNYDHKWEVTADEKIGLVAYLRALKPLSFPEYDAPTTQK